MTARLLATAERDAFVRLLLTQAAAAGVVTLPASAAAWRLPHWLAPDDGARLARGDYDDVECAAVLSLQRDVVWKGPVVWRDATTRDVTGFAATPFYAAFDCGVPAAWIPPETKYASRIEEAYAIEHAKMALTMTPAAAFLDRWARGVADAPAAGDRLLLAAAVCPPRVALSEKAKIVEPLPRRLVLSFDVDRVAARRISEHLADRRPIEAQWRTIARRAAGARGDASIALAEVTAYRLMGPADPVATATHDAMIAARARRRSRRPTTPARGVAASASSGRTCPACGGDG